MKLPACDSLRPDRRPKVLREFSLYLVSSLAFEPTSMRAIICLPKRPFVRATPERTMRTAVRRWDDDADRPAGGGEPAQGAPGGPTLLVLQLSQAPQVCRL